MNAKLMAESILKAGSLNYNFLLLFAKINIGSWVLHLLLMLMTPFHSLIKFWQLAKYAFILYAVGKLF